MNALQPVSFAHVPVRDPRISPKREPGRHSRIFWTEAEDAAIRAWYPVGGAGSCLAHLPDRTRTSIYGRAHKLGVVGPKTSGPRRRIVATAELDETIREAWQNLDGRKKGEVGALADRLGVPRRFLYERALAMGLVIPHVHKEPVWTAAEDDLLRKLPLYDVVKSALIFREHGFSRSPNAIKIRATRLKISRRDTREQLSATKAAKILGIDAKGVTTWILSGDLKATKRDDKRTAQQGGSAWNIEPADLRRFVIDKLQFVDFRKVDKFALVDLLVREAEKTPRGWSAEMDERLRLMWANGDTIEAIGTAIGKSWAAVNTRRVSLGLARRNRPWLEEESARIRTMFETGATDDEIAETLGLKRTDVVNRRIRLGLKRGRNNLRSQIRGDVVRLRSEGVSVRDIAGALGVTRAWVYQILADQKAAG